MTILSLLHIISYTHNTVIYYPSLKKKYLMNWYKKHKVIHHNVKNKTKHIELKGGTLKPLAAVLSPP